MRNLIQDTMQDQEDTEGVVSGPSKGKGKGKVPVGRDDDTHYFDSYAENGMSGSVHVEHTYVVAKPHESVEARMTGR